MSKSTLSILSSILMSTALAVPAIAGAQARYPFLNRFMAGHLLQMEKDGHKAAGENSAGPHHKRSQTSDPGLTVYDDPDGVGTTMGYEINATGSVAGEYQDNNDGHTYGFLRAPDGSFTKISVDGHPTDALWVNAKGWVSGEYLADGIIHAYLRRPSGKFVKFDPPDSQYTQGFNINDAGVATGDYADSNGLWHGYLRAKDGSLTTFEEPYAALGADQGTFAGATNVRGDTTGPYVTADGINHGYIRHSDSSFEEFDAPGAVNTVPYTVNAKGWVVGYFDDENGVLHGFIRKPNGKIIVVDAPDAGTGAGQGTVVNEINKDGIATGPYVDANDVSHGFVFRMKSKTITEFDAPGAGTSPGTGTTSASINVGGEISGFEIEDDGATHGIIETP